METDRPKIYYLNLRGKDEGTKLRVLSKIMTAMVRDGARNYQIRAKAINIIRSKGVRPKDWVGEVRAIQEWVQDNIHYVRDTYGSEVFQTPQRTLALGAGDCDDLSILTAAMLMSIGYRVGIILIDSRGDGIISHAMAAVKLPQPVKPYGTNWIPIETTKKVELGWYPPNAKKRILIEIGVV